MFIWFHESIKDHKIKFYKISLLILLFWKFALLIGQIRWVFSAWPSLTKQWREKCVNAAKLTRGDYHTDSDSAYDTILYGKLKLKNTEECEICIANIWYGSVN
jgi:hypothetical protein